MDTGARSCRFIHLDELGIRRRGTTRRRCKVVGGGRRTTGASHSYALLYYVPSLLFSPPPSIRLAVSPCTLFASLSPSHPTWRTQRPSFSLPSHPLDPPCELSRVQSLTFHRSKLIAAALTYCVICFTFICVVRLYGKWPRTKTQLRTRYIQRKNCIFCKIYILQRPRRAINTAVSRSRKSAI